MVTITRRLAGRLRQVFRQALRITVRSAPPVIVLDAGPAGLRIRCRTADAAVEYSMPAAQTPGRIVLPFALLADVEGRQDEPVELEHAEGRVTASWHDGHVPQHAVHPALDVPEDDWPTLPAELAVNRPGLLQALADASRVTDASSARYALGAIRLRGAAGSLAATDGRQLLVQSGFTFPWDEDLLLPASKLFTSAQLPGDEPVEVGRTATWFVLRTAGWTVWLATDNNGRFPKIEDLVQNAERATASLAIPALERQFLAANLRRLPGSEVAHAPVTVEVNGEVVVRARCDGQAAPTELVLTGATRTGEPLRFHTNREYLARAMALGFERLYLFNPRAPVLCQDEHRQYVWALLDPESAIKPADGAVRIASPQVPAGHVSPSSPSKARMPHTSDKHVPSGQSRNGNGQAPAVSPVETATTGEPASALAQAIALRDLLRDVTGKAADLVRALQHEKKHTRQLRTALASLREIQKLSL